MRTARLPPPSSLPAVQLADCPKPALLTSATGSAACCMALLHASLQRKQKSPAQQQPPPQVVTPRQVFKWLRALGHSLEENQDLAVIVDRLLAAPAPAPAE